MKLWCFDDPDQWGRSIAQEAAGRGHDARLFLDAGEPDGEGVTFVRMTHKRPRRDENKALVEGLIARGIEPVPGATMARSYDDKVDQAARFGKWMPETAVLRTGQQATASLDAGRFGFPLISKSAEGASSHNVRLVRDRAGAEREIALAFGNGIPMHYGERQTGYLLWQKFCLGNDYDFRVIAIGDERVILRRLNRRDVPFASGSGKERPVTFPDPEAEAALAFADAFFAAEDIRWCGIDLVKDEGRFVLLETTVAWPLGKLDLHRTVSGRSFGAFWPIIVDQMETGALRP